MQEEQAVNVTNIHCGMRRRQRTVEAPASAVKVRAPSEIRQRHVKPELAAMIVTAFTKKRGKWRGAKNRGKWRWGSPARVFQLGANVQTHVVVHLFRKVVAAAPKVVGADGIV